MKRLASFVLLLCLIRSSVGCLGALKVDNGPHEEKPPEEPFVEGPQEQLGGKQEGEPTDNNGSEAKATHEPYNENECKDYDERCDRLADIGHCNKTQDWMSKICKKSCRQCVGGNVCPANSEFSLCGYNFCTPTCRMAGATDKKACEKSCGRPACRCKDGWARDIYTVPQTVLKCVPVDQCAKIVKEFDTGAKKKSIAAKLAARNG